VWTDVAVRTAHIDDALAIAATCAALAAATRNKAWTTAVLLGAAATAKPWAIVFIPLSMVPAGRNRWMRPPLVLAAVAIMWLPFVIDDPGTVGALGRFQIPNAASSALRALGFSAAATPPWVRPTQIMVGLLLAGLVVRAGRPHAVVMAGLGSRLMIDPGVHHYYTAGLTFGVLIWELGRRPDRLPWATAVTAVALEASSATLQPAALAGTVRLVVTCSAVIAACVLPDSKTLATAERPEEIHPPSPIHGVRSSSM
jgi:hypothetical protein